VYILRVAASLEAVGVTAEIGGHGRREG